MATIFDKIRTIVAGNVHNLLDAVIDLNAPAAVEQHIRELKASRQTVDNALTKAIADGRTYTTERAKKSARIDELEQVINEILGNDDPNDDAAATPKVIEQTQAKARVAQLDDLIATAGANQGALTEVLAAFDSKIAEMEHRLETLRSVNTSTKAKEEAASALRIAAEQLGKGVGGSVDSALRRAEGRATEAQVGLERAVGAVRATTGTSEAEILAKAEIARRRAAIAAAKQGQAA